LEGKARCSLSVIIRVIYHRVELMSRANYTKAIKKVKRGGVARIIAVPQKVKTSTFFSTKIEVTHMMSVPPTRKGRITENKEGIG
tara:strand:- start:667 stop:921 length:255 start_codon:yes stop_codon:yes gene_type:complete